MAKKDFDAYYYKIFAQYTQLLNEIEEVSNEVQQGMVDSSVLDNFKKMLEPVKSSYESVSYMKYLLDRPTKSKKHEKYDNTSYLKRESGSSIHKVLQENQKIIDKIKDFDFGGKQ